MKRFICLFLSAVLLMFLCVNALGEEIDRSVFEDCEDATFAYDEREGGYVLKTTHSAADSVADWAGGLNLDMIMVEDVCVLRMTMLVMNIGGDLPGFSEAVFHTDGYTYKIPVKMANDVSHAEYAAQAMRIALGETGVDLIEDILDSDEDVLVEYNGTQKNVHFVLSDSQREILEVMFALYAESGAIDQDVKVLNALYPIIKIERMQQDDEEQDTE